MAFYYQPLSDRSHHEQWQRSLDQRNLVNNIDDIVKQQTDDYNNTLREVSEAQAEIMRASTVAICGTISDGLADVTDELRGGFADVTAGLYRIEGGINKLTNLLDWRLGTMIEELRYNNLLTQNIALLLREPDSEKVRQKNIEKGLKFFNDSYRNPFFFNDSLLFLKKAVEDEQTGDHTDYFVLHKIGLIYLYSSAHLDFDEAIEYFNKAATYSEVDTHPDAIRLANILEGNITESLQTQNRTVDDIKRLTGKSFMQISKAYYAQGKFPDSIKYAEMAVKIAPSLLEAGFVLAKSLAASGQNAKAAEILKPVIQQDKTFFSQTLTDRDLATKPEILQMNEELRLEEKNNSLTLLAKSSQLKEKAINEWKIMESSLSTDFNELCKNIDAARDSMNKDNYLSYLKAKKYFNQFLSKI